MLIWNNFLPTSRTQREAPTNPKAKEGRPKLQVLMKNNNQREYNKGVVPDEKRNREMLKYYIPIVKYVEGIFPRYFDNVNAQTKKCYPRNACKFQDYGFLKYLSNRPFYHYLKLHDVMSLNNGTAVTFFLTNSDAYAEQ
ncbi:hypothetical protein RFI_23850, partial [Reticulomyxa filosa]